METLSPRALCTVADVFAYTGNENTDLTDVITRLINAASETIHGEAGREFKTLDTDPATRVFLVDDRCAGWHRHRFDRHNRRDEVQIGDATSISDVEVYNNEDLAFPSDEHTEYVTLPRVRQEPWRPITAIAFPRFRVQPWYEVHVTGVWGFPVVPDDIRQAAVVTASAWLARDIQTYSQTFNVTEDRVELPRSLPPQVFDTVRNYKRMGWS